MQAIRNADHVELFSRADFISKKTNKQRVTISQADDRGGVALTTRFSDKDSVNHREEGVSLLCKRSR